MNKEERATKEKKKTKQNKKIQKKITNSSERVTVVSETLFVKPPFHPPITAN